ncbi:hypothetical protein [Brevibacillus sp. HB2.2]|uniref:hypothetical protein n=1 Tax=Brevibacillus sp. HB2.2 TaxID=2738846 RepID=UPI00156AAEB2|nr:hypothetical protein [Brevibacillus sp. HB2.2]NRS51976.1 hypothetical protein [Brevibacillus sp. HB2.2]
MNYFAENLRTVIGFLFGLYMIYSGIDSLISGEIYIGGRGISSGAIFTRPESIYAAIAFLLIGCFAVFLFIKSILDYKKRE